MKNLVVCLAALSLVACVEGQTKGPNPDVVADPSSAESIFKAPQELPTTGNGGGGSVSLGNGSSVISDLNASQLDDLCQKTEDALNNALAGRTLSDVLCEINAIGVAASISVEQGADFQETCEAVSSDCVEESAGQDSFECPIENGCEATVAEFETCLNSVLPQFVRLQELACVNFDVNSASEIEDDALTVETPECRTFNEKCGASGEEPQPANNVSPNNRPMGANNTSSGNNSNNGNFGE